MEVLKISSVIFFIIGLRSPKYFKNKQPLLFVSVIMAVLLFYIGLGWEMLSFIINGRIKIFSIGFFCFNLAAFFMGVWLTSMFHELVVELRAQMPNETV